MTATEVVHAVVAVVGQSSTTGHQVTVEHGAVAGPGYHCDIDGPCQVRCDRGLSEVPFRRLNPETLLVLRASECGRLHAYRTTDTSAQTRIDSRCLAAGRG